MASLAPDPLGTGSRTFRGWACVITESWDPRASNVQVPPQGVRPPLKVEKGDQVWVFRVLHGYGYVHLPFAKSYLQGWVPLGIVKQGKERVDPPPIELLSQSRMLGQGATNPGPGDNVLHKTLRALWQSVKNNQSLITETLPGIGERTKKVLFRNSSIYYADVVYKCLVPQARTIMANGLFPVERLRTLAQVTPTYPMRPGIYLVIYGDFGDRTVGTRVHHTAVYLGQTTSFQTRRAAHKAAAVAAAHGSGSTHYRLASQAGQMIMVPILLQEGNVPEDFLDIAEFSMLCLLQTWFSGLFKPSDSNAVGAYAMDFDACLMFSRMINQVSAGTGWNPTFAYGLNWNTPILKNASKEQQWTSWYDEASEMYVYRTRRNIWFKPTDYAISWHSRERVQIPLDVANAAGFHLGQSVHLVAELRKRGDEYLTHPFRLFRLPPDIGKNSELEKLKALAVKVQWLPDGETQWKECYLERSQLWGPISKQVDVLRVYQLGIGLLCDLEEVRYTGGPDWLPSYYPAKVQFLRYNHLEQKYEVEFVQPKTIPWPRDRTMQENTQRLMQRLPPASSPDTVIGARPPTGFFTQGRSACDLCYSQRRTAKCEYSSVDHSCKACRYLHRPCTWSRTGEGLTDFVQGGPLEELGIAVHAGRELGPQIKTMASPPFDPNLEAEDHGEQED